nr:EOG090X088H [Triops cancriformis]
MTPSIFRVVLVFNVLAILLLLYNYFNLQQELHQLRRTIGLTHAGISSRDLALETNQFHESQESYVVVYNRVPKTGSTSFVGLAYDLCTKNKYNVLHVNISKNMHILSLADQVRFVTNITSWNEKKPALYHGHMSFVDFKRFGKPSPLYINIVRKPIDRLVSYYYFLRYGDNYRPHLVRKKQGDKMIFDECVKLGKPECDPVNLWLQVPFFCGHAAECWIPGNQWALEQAKRNLIDHYFVVGVTEEMEDFVAVLEAALPRLFHGALQLYRTGQKSHLRKTNQKVLPSSETLQTIQESPIWQLENEFYNFAQENFQAVKQRLLINSKEKGQQFFYEKIRPK